MGYYYRLMLWLLFVPLGSYAQFETKSTYYPSSTGEYSKVGSNTSVDLYSGGLNVTIPFGSITTGGLDLSIAVFYKGTGSKIEDYASSVGLGWNMGVAGYVSRIVRGLPDESADGYAGANHRGDNIASYNFNVIDKGYLDEWDNEPDLFFVSLPSGSFYFVLKPDGSPLILNNSNFKFKTNPYANNSAGYNKTTGFWVILDPSGISYTLGTVSGNEIVRVKLSNESGSKEYTSTWHLVEVSLPNSDEKLKVEYENIGQVNEVYYNSMRTEVVNLTPTACSIPNIPPSEIVQNTEISILNKLILKKIYNDLEQIKFTYSSRTDVTNGRKLDFIEFLDINDVLVKKFKLYTSYFTGLGGVQRLRLDAIDQVSLTNVNLRVARFNYFQLNLPQRNSDSYDHYGYFNVNNSGTVFFPNANKAPDLSTTKANTLITVENNLGGLTKFTYELNEFNDGSANVKTGGLRVAEISYEDQNQVLKTEKYIYRDTLTNQSYGKVQYSQINYQNNILYVLGGSPTNPCISEVKRFGAKSFNDLMDINNNSIGYSTVIKKADDGSKIAYQFTNYDLYPDVSSTFLYNDSGNQGAYAYKTFLPNSSHMNLRGNILAERYYDNANNLLRQITYEYQKITGTDVKALKSVLNTLNINLSKKTYIVSAYAFTREFLLLKKKYETDYSPSASINKVSENFYDQTSHYQPTRVQMMGSDGVLNENRIVYAPDIAGTPSDPLGIYQAMTDQNMVGTVVETKELVNAVPTKGTKINYAQFFTNIYLPSTVQLLDNLSQTYETEIQYHAYDIKGNILMASPITQVKTSYVYSNKGHYPIAEIKNADISTVVSLLGGQTAVDNFRNNVSPTSATVNSFLAPVRSGLTSAEVSSATYSPVLGKISQIDAKGNSTYFEYDPFSRLVTIKDQNGYIVKNFNYNLGNVSPSVTLYYNTLQTQNFTRNNCLPGETGGTVSYYVPYGTYTSTINVAAANQLALDDIAANGQNYANINGSCTTGSSFVFDYSLPSFREFNVVFTNVATSQVYSYVLMDSGTISGIPDGTYNVSINETSYTGNYNFYLGSSFDTGVYVQFMSMPIASYIMLYVQEI
jgi:YD repeat-containing protein